MHRILVVEDSPTQARQLAFILEDAGFEVQTAPDAEDGYARMADGRFDAVLTDLILPGDSGFDLCRRIKADPRFRGLPVLVLTSQADPVNVLRGVEAGADGFMTKDLEPHEVVVRVRRALEREGQPGDGHTRVIFLGGEFKLAAGREQLVNVLLSAFEDVVHLNERNQREIAQRREAERAVRESARRYRSLVVASSQIIWTTGADGRVGADQPTWRAFTGQDESEILGEGWLDALHPEDRGPTAAAWAEAVALRSLFEVEFRLRKCDGTYRYFEARGVPVGEGEDWTERFWRTPDLPARGTPLMAAGSRVREWVGACTDVTERELAEQASRHAREAAEAANRSKSEFLATMSHEIRTPMNGVLGMTDLALETELTPVQREYLTTVKASAEALLTVINDILDFSKIEAGKLDLEPTPFSLRDLVGDALKALAPRAHAAGLELVGRIDPGVPDRLVGDAGRLRQVLINLAGNAVKFTPKGEVVVAVSVTDEAAKQEEPDYKRRTGSVSLPPTAPASLAFDVRDSGIGIPKERLGAIFDPFTQADGSTTRKYGGTGLGLTICAKLAAIMGGRIWVESVPGLGSTFHFTARLGVVVAPLAPDPGLKRLTGLRALVVDDNATARDALRETLGGWGMRPTAAEDGPAALDLIARAAMAGEPFPLVLLDAAMPGMDGLAVARRVSEGAARAATAVILLTDAGRRLPDERSFRDMGVRGRITKPVKHSELLQVLLEALGGASGARPAPAVAAAPGRRARVLLAEDNSVNQKLAVRLLEKQGHTITVAANGREALGALDAADYDVVLMDVQMPEMDGLEATGQIRRREQGTGRHVPIIAMTAHAMKGDRERCLEAGMDGYVSKPIRADELRAAIEALLPPEPAESSFSREVALAQFGGDEDLFREVAQVYLEDGSKDLRELREALGRGDAAQAREAAHSLKGAVSNFGTASATEAAARIEHLAADGDAAGAAAALPALEEELKHLETALRKWTGDEAP